MSQVTPIGRVAFEAVFTPTSYEEGGKPMYQITLLFPKSTNLDELRKLANATAREKWGEKAPRGLRSPFRDGDEMEREEFEGMTFVRFSSKRRPHVVDQRKQPIVEEDGALYRGCYARVSYTCYAYEVRGNAGVAFGLNNVQKASDGDPLGFGSDPNKDFDEIEMELESDAPWS